MNDRLRILQGDCLVSLRTLPAASVQCVVTSPPYWNLRDYQVAGQIGLEETPAQYVAKMVEVFAEVWRVLRDDGVLWLNLGDCYNGSGKSGGSTPSVPGTFSFRGAADGGRHAVRGLKEKDLVGMPWRVAFALQEAGWYLRCDVIWYKPNPMPESVRDRPTKSHEYVFFLTKSDRYFYDGEDIREPVTGNAHARGNGVNPKAKTPGKNSRLFQDRDPSHPSARKSRQNESYSAAVAGIVSSSRQRRSVWEIATQPFREAHFATFPNELAKLCILAGTSAKGCCAACGAPWERVIELGAPDIEHQRACGGDVNGDYFGESTKNFKDAKAQDASATKARILAGMRERKTVDWIATCDCESGQPVPCVVLDPFGGSGTTGQVAIELGRKAILCELNPDYIELIKQRCSVTPGLPL
jgi:DNA modification methylase